MAQTKILLYYVFTPLPDPDAIRLWQRDLAASLGLRGRILLSKDGMNGTVGGEIGAVKRYLRATREYPAFKNLDVKWSDGTGLDEHGQSLDFPKLSVKVREEIVSFGAPGELTVTAEGIQGGGGRIAPDQLHDFVAEHQDTVFFDGRNAFEAEIGRFKNAIVPDVSNTRQFVDELESGRYDHLKDTPIVTYCTGGIRCEVLSGLMKNRGFTEVYQLEGGIVRYGEQFGNDGLWEGSLYVFDARGSIDFAPGAARIGHCVVCETATSEMRNCEDPSCRAQLVACDSHTEAPVRCPTHAGVLA
ncbi:rhodanese-related sulfurtransferase [Mycetocola saprophilus]|uniref:oxygen-dependent tRNA uridine(34) hydroxylase TrhO n=1 Tax=Mycetocola saprophilus TaxID=76636 RepID=UPI003BEF5867